MPSTTLILIGAGLLAFAIFSHGIGKIFKAILYFGAAFAVVMYLGNKSGWTIDGLVVWVRDLGQIFVNLLTPIFDSLLGALKSSAGSAPAPSASVAP